MDSAERDVLMILKKGFEELGIEPVDSLLDALEYYLIELKRWNRTYNITGIKEDTEIVQKHFLDSLLYLEYVKDTDEVMDVGTGGGFPGLVMKLMKPSLRMILVEPSRKKVAFLKHIIYDLKLKDVTIYQKRVEELKDIKVDVVVSRALFSLKEMIKRTSHILKENGLIVMNKGPEVLDELKIINKKYSHINIRVNERILPTTGIKRYLVMVKFNRHDKDIYLSGKI